MLTKDDKKWSEDMMYRVMTKFYQVVIAPKMATKDDIGRLETKMEHLDMRVETVESKVSSLEKAMWNISDNQGKKLDNHEERITVIEGAGA